MDAQRRWPVISALGVVQILAWGSSFYLPAVLAEPIARDTGWPLAWVVGGLSLGLLVAGIVSPRVGSTIGRQGGRSVLAASAILLALGLAVLGLSPTLPVFILGWLVIGAGMGAGLYDAAFATLGRIYGAEARSAITTLTLWGGFASTVCWPLSAFLVAHVGWRDTCFAYAAIQMGVSLPLILTMLPRLAPASVAADRDRPSSIGSLTPQDRRAFLLLGLLMTIGGAVTAIVGVHLLTLLQARGLALAAAVSLGTLIGPAQVGGRLIEMMGGGRHHPLWTLGAAMGLTALGLLLLALNLTIPALALVLFGAGNGVYSIARGTLPLALFGPERYPMLAGRLALPSLLAQALAPSIGALIIERRGADPTFAVLVVLAMVNVLITVALTVTYLSTSKVRPQR